MSIPNDDVTMLYVLMRITTALPATCFAKLPKYFGRPPSGRPARVSFCTSLCTNSAHSVTSMPPISRYALLTFAWSFVSITRVSLVSACKLSAT